MTAWRIESACTSRRAKGFVLHSGQTITLDNKPSPQAGYNYPVQGAAGDVTYAALAEIDMALEGLDAEPILVVHDKIVLERGLINFTEDVGRKRRAIVPMNSQLQEAMEEAFECATCEYVIEWAGKQVINPRKSVSRSAERAGLGKLGKHALRHTAATWLVMDGWPDEETARHIGTTVDVVRKVCGHHAPDFLISAAKALEI